MKTTLLISAKHFGKLKKLQFIKTMIETLAIFKQDDFNDSTIRCILRFFFILIDNFLKIIGNIKNDLLSENFLNKKVAENLKKKIYSIENSYDGVYDVIRDKISAHQQQINLINSLEWYSEIDEVTIVSFFNDIIEIIKIIMRICPGGGNQEWNIINGGIQTHSGIGGMKRTVSAED